MACFPLSQHPGSAGFTRPSITTDQAATLPRTTPAPTLESAGIFHRDYLLVTLGACALVFLAAFESLAVTTIMPLVSRELDGAALYALAFAGPLATGVIGMVAAGNWSDRRGPVGPLYASVAMFVLGLLIAGTASDMPALVAGRLVQGLGGGAMTVALYVVIARVYPPVLHPKIFAAFSAAWVIPSLVGPFAAGIVAQMLSWHWVFLGVVGLVVPALLMIVPALRGLRGAGTPGDGTPGAEHRRNGAAPEDMSTPAPRRSTGSRQAGLGRPRGARRAWPEPLPQASGGRRSRGCGGRRRGPHRRPPAGAAGNPDGPPGPPQRYPHARPGLCSVLRRRGVSARICWWSSYVFRPPSPAWRLRAGPFPGQPARRCRAGSATRLDHRRAVRIGAAIVLGAVVLVLVTTLLELAGRRRDRRVGGSPGGGMGLMYARLSVMTLALSSRDERGLQQLGDVHFRFTRRRAVPRHHGDHLCRVPDDGGVLRRRLRPDGGDRRRSRRGRPAGRRAPVGRRDDGSPGRWIRPELPGVCPSGQAGSA